MTFDAMSAWTAFALLGGVGAAAAWLFLRKLRPPRKPIASLLLWRRVLDEAHELTLWERIRRTVSLIVTVAIALMLALAVTRPAWRSGATSGSGGRTLIVIDSSWSMSTRTASGESRWDRALQEARRLAEGADDEVALATTADGLVAGPTTDPTLIVNALKGLSAGGGDAASWPQLAGSDRVHFVTDGAVAHPVAAGVVVHSVFEAAENVAITALDVRPALGTANSSDAYLEIANFARSAQTVRLTLTRGTASILDRDLSLGAGETLRQVIPLAGGADPALRAHVDAPRNALRLDDEAFAWIEHARPLSVTIVGTATDWLRPLFAGDPEIHARFVNVSGYTPEKDASTTPQSGDHEDLVVFDRWAPREPPANPALMIAPPVDTPWLASGLSAPASSATAAESNPRWEVIGPHPIVRGVDSLTLAVAKARAYGSPALVPVAQSTQGTPLVCVDDARSRRMVVVTFGPDESNLASAPAFPVLMGNAMDWLVRREVHRSRPVGLTSFSKAAVRVSGPGGSQIRLAPVGGANFGLLREPGFYVVDEGASQSTFAVNIGDPQLSNVGRTTLGPTELESGVKAGLAGRSWWVYCTACAFGMLLVEWWTWQRRITV
jgi:hypothetical protein